MIAMESCIDLSAQGISEVIMNALEIYKVDTKKMLCQCYDGAFVMSGETGGVQTILQSKLKRRIPYVHCFSHRLHLVVAYQNKIGKNRKTNVVTGITAVSKKIIRFGFF